MMAESIKKTLYAMLEALAEIEHKRWSHWQQYMHDHGAKQPDGSLVIPAHLVSRWERQMKAPYEMLSEEEKQSDRDQVLKYLPKIVEGLTDCREES